MPNFKINIIPFGNQAILLEWPNKIDDNILEDIIHFSTFIVEEEKRELVNYTPSYNSLLLQYDFKIDFDQKRRFLIDMYNSQKVKASLSFKTWHIPVCYDDDFGMDLSLFMDRGLSKNEIIQLHTSSPFRVFMIGFLPGFLYLGGLPNKLYMNRKEKPRSYVPKGSVAIGGEQTGIYPMSSPGGWQIIGRTPLTLFDLTLDNPSTIRQGDYILFYSIDLETYNILNSHQ